MNTLTVLDYEEGLVYQYIIDTDKELDSDDFEDILINQNRFPLPNKNHTFLNYLGVLGGNNG